MNPVVSIEKTVIYPEWLSSPNGQYNLLWAEEPDCTKKNSATHVIKLGFEPNSYPHRGYQDRLCTNRMSTGAIEIIQV
jgi:hypothetical protein